MLRLLSLIALMLVAPLCRAADEDTNILQEYARHYQELPAAVDTYGVDVVELFSYHCSICNGARANVAMMQKNLPAGKSFHAYAVRSSRAEWQVSAKAFLAFETAGLSPTMHDSLFNYIHVDKQPMKGDGDIEAFFTRAGHPELIGRADSPEAAALAARIDQLWKASQSRVVPTFIVGGRYKVLWGSDQTPEKFSRLVNALLKNCGCEAPR